MNTSEKLINCMQKYNQGNSEKYSRVIAACVVVKEDERFPSGSGHSAAAFPLATPPQFVAALIPNILTSLPFLLLLRCSVCTGIILG
jgi:hypothetical protein